MTDIDTLTFDELRVEVRRLKDQLAEAEKQWNLAAKDAAKFALQHADLRDKFAEADANGLRLAEENERLAKYNVKMHDRAKEAKAEVERLRVALEQIAKAEAIGSDDNGDDLFPWYANIARQVLEGSASEVHG